MKKLFAVIAQFVLFLFLDALGGMFYQPFHLTTVLSSGALMRRTFFWDGIVFMAIAYLVLVLIAALRNRLGRSLPVATAALFLAAIAGYLLKLGFKTQDL